MKGAVEQLTEEGKTKEAEKQALREELELTRNNYQVGRVVVGMLLLIFIVLLVLLLMNTLTHSYHRAKSK